MTEVPRENEYLLPARARLFHIGQPKTGTTMLQTTAATLRTELLALGVRYPRGAALTDHRFEVAAFMGLAWGGRETPSVELWNKLMSVVDDDDENRIWVSHEFAAESSEETATAFCDALGDRVHIVLTMRHYGSSLASTWQQYVKNGVRTGFVPWLEAILQDPPRADMTPTFRVRSDQGLLVKRWAGIVGPENLTVIISDKTRPTLITDGFEDLLGLPRRLLTSVPLSAFSANRSMSVEESELLRALNVDFRRDDESVLSHRQWVKSGVALGLLRRRSPGPTETAFVLPDWAANRATERGARYADEIEASGVRIIGDLATLRAPARGEASPSYERNMIPLDLATTALMSVIDSGKGFVAQATPKPVAVVKPRKAMADASGRELLREAAKRVRRRIRRSIGRFGPGGRSG